MTELEKELRILLNKYDMKVCEVSILFNNNGRNILAISFEESGKEDVTRNTRIFNKS